MPAHEGLVPRLFAAALRAEAAEDELSRSAAAYAVEPTAEALERVRDSSRVALQREAEFDSLWQEASSALFGGRARG